MKTTTRTVIGIILVGMICLTVVGLVSALQEAKSTQYYTERGANHLAAGECDEAIFAFTRAIELDPDTAMAYFGRGLAHFKLGGWADREPFNMAISDFTSAIELYPDFTQAYYNRGLAYNQHYNRGENRDPADPADYHAKAIADFNKALEIDPGFVLAYAGIGNAHTRSAEPENAIEWYDKALESKGVILQTEGRAGVAGVYASKGRAYKAMDMPAAVWMAEYRTALNYDPALGTAISHLGSGYMKMEEWDKALELYIRLIELKKDDPTYLWLFSQYQRIGDCYYHLGEYEKAMDAYQTALAEHRPDLWPIYDRIFAGIGNVHIALGNYDEARNNFNIAVGMTDRDTRHVAEALSGLATVYEEYEEYDEAREALESAAAMYEKLEMHEKAEEARTRAEKLP